MGVANISGNILTDSGASLSSYLPLTGGTLTGALNGTTALFTGTITSNNAIGVEKNGSNTFGGGGRFYLYNAATTDGLLMQLNASNNLDFWGVTSNTPSASPVIVLTRTGAATFSSSVMATSLTLSNTDGYLGTINSTGANGGYFEWRTSGTTIADIGTSQQIFGTGGNDTFGINGRGARSLVFGTNNTERMRITSGGNVGINTTNPGYKLEVNVNGGNGSTAAIANLFGGSNIANQNCYLYLGNTNVGMSATVDGGGTPRNNLYAFANGAGVVLNSGATSWVSNSDELVKDIIEPINNAVDKISNFRTVVYKFKNEEDKRRLGLIAQDVEKVFPEIVSDNYSAYFEKDVKGVAYTELIPVLVKAIQELSAKVTALENK